MKCDVSFCNNEAVRQHPNPYFKFNDAEWKSPDSKPYPEFLDVCETCYKIGTADGDGWDEDSVYDAAIARSAVLVEQWTFDQYAPRDRKEMQLELYEQGDGNRFIIFPMSGDPFNTLTINTYYDQWGTYYYFEHNGKVIGTIASEDGTRSFIRALTQALTQLNMDQPRMKEPTKAAEEKSRIILGEAVLPYADALEIANTLKEHNLPIPWSLNRVLRNESYAHKEAVRLGDDVDPERKPTDFDDMGQIETILNDVR